MKVNTAMSLLVHLGVFACMFDGGKRQYAYGTAAKASRISEAKQKARDSNVSMDMYRYSLKAGVGCLKSKNPFSLR